MSTKSKMIPYWMLLVVLGAILLWLNSAFCLFHGKVPFGKMNAELDILSERIQNVLVTKGYCENKNSCAWNETVFLKTECTETTIDIYNPSITTLDPKTISEIIATIAEHSTFSVHVSVYNSLHQTSCCFLTPFTEVYIIRRKS